MGHTRRLNNAIHMKPQHARATVMGVQKRPQSQQDHEHGHERQAKSFDEKGLCWHSRDLKRL
jgi:hypothetical protein